MSEEPAKYAAKPRRECFGTYRAVGSDCCWCSQWAQCASYTNWLKVKIEPVQQSTTDMLREKTIDGSRIYRGGDFKEWAGKDPIRRMWWTDDYPNVLVDRCVGDSFWDTRNDEWKIANDGKWYKPPQIGDLVPDEDKAEYESILEEAKALTNGDRRSDYGSPLEDATRIAAIWSAIIDHPIAPRLVPLMMVGLKLSRQTNRHKRDNLVDVAGWAATAQKMEEERAAEWREKIEVLTEAEQAEQAGEAGG